MTSSPGSTTARIAAVSASVPPEVTITLFMEVMAASAASPGRQPGGLPAQYAPGKMLVVGKACGLRRQRCRYRALSRAAGENHLFSLGIRDGFGIEGRERHNHAGGIGFRRHLVRFADVDQEVASVLNSLRHLVRCQILHLMIRHAKILPKIQPCGRPSGALLFRRQSRLSRSENQAL